MWNSVSLTGAVTYTLGSALAWSGTLTFGGGGAQVVSGAALSGTGAAAVTTTTSLTLNNTGGLVTTGTLTLPNAAVTFAGSAGFTAGTLANTALTASRTWTLTFGRTYTVNTALNVAGTVANRAAIVSSSAGNKVVFNLTIGATQSAVYVDPTDVDSSGGQTVVSVGGTITTTTNWVGSVPNGGGSPGSGSSRPCRAAYHGSLIT